MNEQQLQQILTIQQAIAAAATAAVINSLLNPQQAAGLANANALTDSSNDLQQQHQHHQHQQQQHQQHHQQQHQQQQQQHHQHQQHQHLLQLQHLQQENRQSPNSPGAATPDPNAANNRTIQDLLAQLQQQASMGASPLALNLNQALAGANHGGGANLGSPIRSPPLMNRLSSAQELNAAALAAAAAAATSSCNTQSQNQPSPIKKLKRHHQQQQQQAQTFQNRSLEATSKPQHSVSPKNHSSISNLARSNGAGNTSTSSSSTFIANNVGLPRKLVRGQDVWLGRGAEQTRQILKCMWCGQSFRTLAEMTQHMKITQHYTNIISQEQITSWRQPEGSDVSSKHGKNSAQTSLAEDNQDDLSDKFNDSDRDDLSSNEDDLETHKSRLGRSRFDHSKSDSADNNSIAGSTHEESPGASKGSPSSKPLTRSKKREHGAQPSNKLEEVSENSPVAFSPNHQQQQQQQQRQNSPGGNSVSNLIIPSATKEDSESNKEYKTNGDSEKSPDATSDKPDVNDENSDLKPIRADNQECNDEDDSKQEETPNTNQDSTANLESKEMTNDGDGLINDDDGAGSSGENENENENENDNDNDDERASETNASTTPTPTSGAKVGPGKGETGDPLSALETMVEKSFDPRLRPGVANGGILQRLGIDEEVCPPWQHINYANWYAAAAYGHPMAAALLAAGINLQNGIKLSKNIGQKKKDE